MNCLVCGEKASRVTESRVGYYREETVSVPTEFFRCGVCGEEFFTPDQMKTQVLSVKNEVRRKHGLLSPERIVEIRTKLGLSQSDLELLLGVGQKVVVRWESGKVIQGSGQDNLLRLLDQDPRIAKALRQIQETKNTERGRSRIGGKRPRHTVAASAM